MIGLGEAALPPPPLHLVHGHGHHPHPAPNTELRRDQQRAARLWPDSPRNQREWLRAVAVVRRTSQGWLLERRITRSPQP